jgi:RND family efflux transporter MFP subunit
MASTLRDDLASLKIDRPGWDEYLTKRRGSSPGRRGGGLRLVSWLLWVIPLGLLSAAGFYGYRQYELMRSRPVVTVGLVQRMTTGEADKVLTAKGYLKSRYQATIGTKIPGRVEQMCVVEGMKVKKGDTLAVIEHNDLKAMLASREAQAQRTAAELTEARTDLWEKEREDLRVARLFAKKSATPEESEKAQAGHKKAAARVTALEAGVKLMKANVEELKATIVTMHLYAPFDGTVLEKLCEEGEIINPMTMNSSQGRWAVATIANLQKMDVETDISEGLMSRVVLGQPAEVSVSAVPAKRYRGRLRQVIAMGDRTRGTIKAKVEILDPDDKLFPELAATVHFLRDHSSSSQDASGSHLFVPKSAVFQESGHDHVWVAGPKNVLHKRQVEVATTNDSLARVESGLEPGESVVLNPDKTLRENDTIRIAD